jgi:hypothetical protein
MRTILFIESKYNYRSLVLRPLINCLVSPCSQFRLNFEACVNVDRIFLSGSERVFVRIDLAKYGIKFCQISGREESIAIRHTVKVVVGERILEVHRASFDTDDDQFHIGGRILIQFLVGSSIFERPTQHYSSFT